MRKNVNIDLGAMVDSAVASGEKDVRIPPPLNRRERRRMNKLIKKAIKKKAKIK